VLRAEHFYQLGEALHRCFDLSQLKEFTIECEVKSVTLEKLKAFQEIGVNRISFGVQTLNPVYRELFTMTATVDQIRQVAAWVNERFPFTNVDLIYGMAGQTLDDFLTDVDRALTTWLIGLLHDRLPKRRMILGGPALAGVAYLLFLFHPGPGAIFPIFLIVSIGSACSLVPVPVYLATAVPNELRGRTYSFINALDALASLVAYSALAAVGLLLPPGVLLATAGGILLIGIPLCTFVLKGNRALYEHELQH